MLYRYALRQLRDEGTAQEVVQGVSLEAWRRPGGFDPSVASMRVHRCTGTSVPDDALVRRARTVDIAGPTRDAGRAVADVTAMLLAHLTGAAVLLALGVMLAAVGSVLVGALAVIGGGTWLVLALRRV